MEMESFVVEDKEVLIIRLSGKLYISPLDIRIVEIIEAAIEEEEEESDSE